MKTIIAGSRSIKDYDVICKSILKICNTKGISLTEIVSGGADGPDTLGEMFAAQYDIPVKQFLPDWKSHGKSGGMIRNTKMGNYAECLIAFWDGNSHGTKHMISYAKSKGLIVYVFDANGNLNYESTNIST